MWNRPVFAPKTPKIASFSSLTSLISLASLILPERWMTADFLRADDLGRSAPDQE